MILQKKMLMAVKVGEVVLVKEAAGGVEEVVEIVVQEVVRVVVM